MKKPDPLDTETGSVWMAVMLHQLGQRCVMELVLLAVLSWVTVWAEEKIIFDRHAVYWNSSNPK